MFLQQMEHEEITVFTISKSLIDIKDFITNHDDIISWIEVIYDDDIMIIISLYTCPHYKNNGYASILLYVTSWIAQQKEIFFIELDDMSSRYRKRNNFYIKHGFNYISNDSPEMHGHISSIKRNSKITDDVLQEMMLNNKVKLCLV